MSFTCAYDSIFCEIGGEVKVLRLRYAYPNREEFDVDLAAWYVTATPHQWIEPGAYARKPSVRITHRGVVFELKAETNREAVGRYLELLRWNPGIEWTVVPNARGRFNKLAVGNPPTTVEKFWVYVKPSDENLAAVRFA